MGDPRVDLWNRAAVAIMDGHPSDARVGDVALERVIGFDGEVQANGLLARAEIDDGFAEALDAWRWFGPDEVAVLADPPGTSRPATHRTWGNSWRPSWIGPMPTSVVSQ